MFYTFITGYKQFPNSVFSVGSQIFDVVFQRLQTFSKMAHECFAIRRAIACKKWHMPTFLKKMPNRLQILKDID